MDIEHVKCDGSMEFARLFDQLEPETCSATAAVKGFNL